MSTFTVAREQGDYFVDAEDSDTVLLNGDSTKRLLFGVGEGTHSVMRLQHGAVVVQNIDVERDMYVGRDVGVGTTSPQARVDVRGSTSRLQGSGDTGFRVFSDHPSAPAHFTCVSGKDEHEASNMATFGCSPSRNAFIRYNDADRVTIDRNGYVGIGTTSPQDLLHVDGNALIEQRLRARTVVAEAKDSHSGPTLHVTGACNVAEMYDEHDDILFTVNTSDGGRLGVGTLYPRHALHVDNGDIFATGNLLMSSDERLKRDIRPIGSALDKVNHLNGYTFLKNNANCEKRKGRRDAGLLAQEVMGVHPEVVDVDDDGYMSVAYGNMMGLVIEAIKELCIRLDALQKGKI